MASQTDTPRGGDAYRPEIDGLRAIAVVSVMLYHAEVPGLGAGFLGVDIFFAISGFLITGIIVRSADQGRFSLPGFWMRRIRRIIPALAIMCLVTLPFACLLMIPDDLENYGQSLVATGLSANNVLLYLTSGYFQLETLFKPLFHTWSLGVEEQYYVIVPLLLLLAMRWGGRSGVFVLLAISSAASLLICEILRHVDSNANFMLLPSRFWELGLGGLAAIARPALLGWTGQRMRLREALAAIGLLAMLSGLFVLRSSYGLPGWEVLLPLVGTCLVLAFAERNGVSRLLAARPMAALGLISYSAYLYHAPIYAFVRIASLDAPSPMLLVATMPVCLLLAWLSWRYVEQPLRDVRRTSDRFVLWFCGITLGLSISCGLILHVTGGLFNLSAHARHDPQLRRGLTASYNLGPNTYQGRPFPTADRSRNVMVLGNSFARDFINMGLETGALSGRDLSYEMIENCEPIPPGVIARIRDAQAVIFGSGVSGDDAPCLVQKIAMLEAMQVPQVAVLGFKQFGYNYNAVMRLPQAERYAHRATPLAAYLKANAEARRIIPARNYVDLFDLLDDGTRTVPVFTPERKFISQDRKHLTQAGARYLGEKVFAEPQFAWLRPKP